MGTKNRTHPTWLETIQVYTRITIIELKKIHSRYHPWEKIECGVK